MSEEWAPTDEDIAWTKGVVESLEIGQDWMEGEMAFRKIGDASLLLLTRTERAEGASHRVRTVLELLGWDLDESQARIIPDDPMLAAEMMQEEAQSWLCPHCNEVPVVNMDLENAGWDIVGNNQFVDESGHETIADRWVIGLTCECEEIVYLSPDDYYLVAGEELFYTWKGWFPVKPEQICEAVDKGYWDDLNAQALGSNWDGKPVPLHMRGLMCVRRKGEEEE
tara:strand:- start:5 stop:676 length:672 start_codon:yes stop_codon:yes gene_type:complete